MMKNKSEKPAVSKTTDKTRDIFDLSEGQIMAMALMKNGSVEDLAMILGRDKAKELIEKYFMTAEGISVLYKYDPRGPARFDVLEKLSKNDPDLANFMKSAVSGTPMPNVPEMGAVWGAMGSAINFVTTGRSTPKDALNQAVNQIKASLSP